MFTCYNENTHTCDGRCQGASDCPMAQDMNVSKRVMKLYIEDAIARKEKWDNIIEELHKNEEFLKYIEKLKMKSDVTGMVYSMNNILLKDGKII